MCGKKLIIYFGDPWVGVVRDLTTEIDLETVYFSPSINKKELLIVTMVEVYSARPANCNHLGFQVYLSHARSFMGCGDGFSAW